MDSAVFRLSPVPSPNHPDLYFSAFDTHDGITDFFNSAVNSM